jgi:tetraacyldisaccharide 4'-kinase
LAVGCKTVALRERLMREPAFWWRPGGGGFASPIAALYGAVASLRMLLPGCKVGIPVICLGNFTVGGGGKTPAALTIGRLLVGAGAQPFFLTRGYGGRLTGPLRVDPARHSAVDVGDEPLLLARLAPTIVARDRRKGAEAARAAGASVLVLDDGFQNPALSKQLAILLVDGRRGIGNGRIIPAGPLRAPLATQMACAHALVLVEPTAKTALVEDLARQRGMPVYHARIEPDPAVIAKLAGRAVLAFAGIADPEKFFATLEKGGIAVAERVSFPDHHRYTASDAAHLAARADAGLTLITTEKDFVRLAGDPALDALAARATALPVTLVIDHGLAEMVFAVLGGTQRR